MSRAIDERIYSSAGRFPFASAGGSGGNLASASRANFSSRRSLVSSTITKRLPRIVTVCRIMVAHSS